jgi:PKD repeat protein
VRTTSASGFGLSTACAFVDNYNYNYNAVGQRDYLYTPVYNFGNRINALSKLKFDYAYARDNSGATDSLQVMVSTDCGVTWTSLWKYGGVSLQTTTTTYNSTFVPTAAQWKRDSTISLAPYVGLTSVQFAFININRYGNSILLDNINIDTIVGATGCTRPTAAFVASPTTVTAGSTVTFTDQSTNAPTAWAWTFPGGTPATSAVQAPGAVTFSTVGTYTTKLRVTNACGSDSTTVTITVVAAGGTSGCDTLSHLLVGDSARIYGAGTTPVWGFLTGTNSYRDLAKAEKYTNVNGRPITAVIFGFGFARSAGATDSLTVRIWDANGTSGLPGTVLGTTKVSMNTVATNVNGTPFRYTVATFPTPVTTNATFYAGFNINNTPGDTIAVASTSQFNGANHAYQGYELNALTGGGTQWGAIDTDWGISLSMYIFPIQCSASTPTAAFIANKTSLCPGDSVRFTDQSTGSPTSWSWQVNGPVNLVSSLQNPTFTFTTPGTYTVILTASNGAGNGSFTRTSYITVNALPTETMASTPVSCFGGSDGTATVTASGGTSYTYLWSPGAATTATISGKPAGTYTVTVTSNLACSSTASVSITQPFSALTATTSFTSAYCNNSNGTVSVTAGGGNGGFTYSWSPGGAATATVSNLVAATYTVTVRDSKNCSVTGTASVTNQTAPVTISFSNTNSTCGASNGSIVASINGSSNGAHYIWSRGDTTGSITNVAAGIYTVTITNSLGCSASKSDTLRGGGPTVTVSTTPVSCFGAATGSATATVTGNTGTVTYLWSPGGGTTPTISNKAAGTYTVTVTDGSCTATANGTITQPATAVSASATSTPVTCFGGSTGTATATGSGGTGTLTYTWSPGGATTPGLTGKPAGTYTVTVKDANLCSATASTTIGGPSSAVAVSVVNTPVSCFGGTNGTATATGSGGTGTLTYTWSPGGATSAGITVKPAGTYTVTVKDANLCSATASTTIAQPSAAVTASVVSTPVICTTTGTATVTGAGGNTGGYIYLWSNTQTTATATNLAAATYTVTVKDSKQCSAVTSVAVVDQSLTLSVTITKTDATCGNSTGSATAHTTASGVTYTWSPGGTHATSLSNIAAGTYSVVINDANGCSASATTNVQNSNGTQVTTSSTPVTCFGSTDGTATVSATGGSGNYTYVWSGGGATTPGITGKPAGSYTVTVSDGTSCNATASVLVGGPSAAVSASATSTPVICNTSGTATVTGSGGNTGGYTYVWSQNNQTTATISNLTASTYTVTVRDSKQCSATASVTVANQSPTITVTINKSDASCGSSNGTAAANTTASGATYLWSPGGSTAASLSGLAAGTYNVTITDGNGCSASATTNIVNTSGPSVSISGSTNPSCHGVSDGTATVAASGGSGGYSYTWSGNGGNAATATGLAGGVYTVTVSSGGCSTATSVLLSEPTSVSVTTTSSPVICTTLGTATATGTGGTGPTYTYLWSNNLTTQTITGLAASTTYTVTVHDSHNCVATASATITTQASTLSDSATSTNASTATSANGTATAHPVGGAPNYTYTWSNGQHSQTAIQLLPGIYTCTITDMFGCTTVATATVNQGPNGIGDISTVVNYTVSPNPASDKVTISLDMNESLPVEITIYSLIGQKVWSKDLGHIRSASEVVDIHDLAEGVYIVKLKAAERVYTTRLIRE